MRSVPSLIPIFIALSFLALSSCRESSPQQEPPITQPALPLRPQSNSIYHWKTTFNLNDEELAFLRKHSIHRMYVRYFDVDLESSPMNATTSVVPIGTTAFKSGKPDGVEIVPTVFITVKALASTGGDETGIEDLALKIYTRVRNMTDYNDLGPMHEIQLDCDWTSSTRDIFYSLCKEMAGLAHPDTVMVSSTIRLHQLSMDPPPVDRGVLMVYNTGAIRQSETKNSILDYDDVKMYLGGKEVRYGLPLDFALPVYGWGVLFRNGAYQGILHHTDFSDGSRFDLKKDGTIRVKQDHMLDGRYLWEGDVIRMEYPSFEEIDKAAGLVVSSIPDPTHSIILYHLDSDSLLKYNEDEISHIYSY